MANATIPYIIAEDGYYYIAYKEKAKVPEIVVSAKGVANGLSEEYNDGWDFGPDSYSPTSTSAIPYTQTLGINEAIKYLYSIGGGKMRLTGGVFDVTNAPLVEDPNNSGQYAQIYFPYTQEVSDDPTTPGAGVSIEIESDFEYPAFANETNSPQWIGSYIYSGYSGSENVNVLYSMYSPNERGGLISLGLTIKNLFVVTAPVSNINAINLNSVRHIEGDFIGAATSNVIWDYTSLPTATGGTGIQWNIPSYGSTRAFTNVYTAGYNIGFIPNTHTYAGKYETYFANIGVEIQMNDSPQNAAYSAYIGYYDCQMTAIAINAITGKLHIDLLSYGDVETTSGYYFTYTYHIQILSGNSGVVTINASTVNMTGTSSDYLSVPNFVPKYNIAGTWKGYIKYMLPSDTVVNGTTAGTFTFRMLEYGSHYTKYFISFSGYENDTTTDQTADFPIPFTTHANTVSNSTGLTVTISLSGITITAPDATTTYSGIVIVEGY